ncbi:MAG TPA: PspA/IM30 family protein [Candidatus Dormibacteraeota bacterium]|nr:PspA/IM30 family protein [Candidatus Dormibacteraeota bacterium]
MGILERITRLVKASATVALAPAPDPRVTYLTAHQKQRALLRQVDAAHEEVAAAKARLEATADAVRQKLPAMEDQARRELHSGNEAMARLMLQRRMVVLNELQTLEKQLAEVGREEGALVIIQQRLAGQIEAFAARQEVIKARYSAAEAQVRINEAMTGVSQDFADLTSALQHAEQTTEDMQARATAIDRLVEDGDLEAITFGGGSDAIDARYRSLGADEDVEKQLKALRDLEPKR